MCVHLKSDRLRHVCVCRVFFLEKPEEHANTMHTPHFERGRKLLCEFLLSGAAAITVNETRKYQSHDKRAAHRARTRENGFAENSGRHTHASVPRTPSMLLVRFRLCVLWRGKATRIQRHRIVVYVWSTRSGPRADDDVRRHRHATLWQGGGPSSGSSLISAFAYTLSRGL